MRLYVLLTGARAPSALSAWSGAAVSGPGSLTEDSSAVAPLRAFLCGEGLVRVCTQPYEPPSVGFDGGILSFCLHALCCMWTPSRYSKFQ